MHHESPDRPTDHPWIKAACQSLLEQWKNWRTGAPKPSLDEALNGSPPEQRKQALRELLRIDIRQRQQAGEVIRNEDYRLRFPAETDVVDEVCFELCGLSTDVHLPTPPPVTDSAIEAISKIGRYELRQVLGEGAFGTVHLAFDPQLNRDVVIKVPRADRLLDTGRREEFLSEARHVARLKHPGIVQIYDVVDDDRGRIGIVQEFVAAGNLRQWWKCQSPTPNHDQIADLIANIADAIATAHQCGLFHRDLKPENILMDGQGRPRVADFGLALAADARVNLEKRPTGTPYYMSPEQVHADTGAIDGRTDVWSLGVILYELLTGQVPFSAPTVEELFRTILTVDPRSPREINPEISRDLSQICLKCLKRSKEDRYETAADLGEALRATRRTSRGPVPGSPHDTETILEFHASFQRRRHAQSAVAKEMHLDRYVWPALAWEDPQDVDEHGRPRLKPVPGDDREAAANVLRTLWDGQNIVLCDDSGTGKTAFTFKLIDLLLSDECPLPFLKRRRPLVVRLEGQQFRDAQGNPSMIAEYLHFELRMALEHHGEEVMESAVTEAVREVLRERRVVVLVDAFDQMAEADRQEMAKLWDGKAPSPQVNLHAGQCHWLITGRPYALRKYQRRLDALRPWRLRLQGLTPEQQDHYFEDYNTNPFFVDRKIKPLDWVFEIRRAIADDLAVPFNLREIRRLVELDLERGSPVRQVTTTAELRGLVARALLARSIAQYAWESVPEGAERPEEEREQLSQLLSVCGVLAFQLMLEQRYNASVDTHENDYEVVSFLARARHRFLSGQDQACEHSRPLRNQARWQWSVAMLEKIEFSHRGDIDAFNPQCRSFRDRKTMEWYAAYYLMSHATDADLLNVIPGAGERCARDFAFDDDWLSNCWRQAIDMPEKLVRDEAAIRSLGVLFAPPRENEPNATRPCEHLWRVWERWLEPMDPSGRKLCGADNLIARFRSEFTSLCEDGGDAARQTLALGLRFDEARDSPDMTLKELNKTAHGWYRRIPPEGASTTFQGERPARVTVSPFWLRKFVVTNAEYRLFDPHHRSRSGNVFNVPDRPVEGVNWYMARMFSRWLGAGYGLPTEAQWEAACRANSSGINSSETEYWFGDREKELAQHAWYAHNMVDKGNAGVRTYSLLESMQAGGHENRWGLVDMAGNVWEWCQDWYGDYDASRRSDPIGPLRGSYRVYRGGGWIYLAGYCRSAFRNGDSPESGGNFMGFRLALVPSRGSLSFSQPAGPPETAGTGDR